MSVEREEERVTITLLVVVEERGGRVGVVTGVSVAAGKSSATGVGLAAGVCGAVVAGVGVCAGASG